MEGKIYINLAYTYLKLDNECKLKMCSMMLFKKQESLVI